MITLTVNTQKLFSKGMFGTTESLEDKNVKVFYYRVVIVTKTGRTICSVPVSRRNRNKENIFIYGQKEMIGEKHRHEKFVCVDLDNDRNIKVDVHLYKICKHKNLMRIGNNRMITPDTSDSDDISVFKICTCNSQKTSSSGAFTINHTETYGTLNAEKEIKLAGKENNSILWYTQRHFYLSSQFSISNESERLLTERILLSTQIIENDFMLDYVKNFGNAMSKGFVTYVGDTAFDNTEKNADFGDCALESTTFGDCEDFAHFYSRSFHLLFNINRVMGIKSPIDGYKPVIYICRIKQGGELIYHSTMLLLPQKKNPNTPVISFEVTCPDASCIVLNDHPHYKNGGHVQGHREIEKRKGIDREMARQRAEKDRFYKWHVESYVLLDAHVRWVLERSDHANIHTLDQDLFFENASPY